MSLSAQAAVRSRRESAGGVPNVRMTCASHANCVTRVRQGRMAALGVEILWIVAQNPLSLHWGNSTEQHCVGHHQNAWDMMIDGL